MVDIIPQNIPELATVEDEPAYFRAGGVVYKARPLGTKEWEQLKNKMRRVQSLAEKNPSDKTMDTENTALENIIVNCVTPVEMDGNPQTSYMDRAKDMRANHLMQWDTSEFPHVITMVAPEVAKSMGKYLPVDVPSMFTAEE